MVRKKCKECGKEFETNRANVIYCSDVCRFKAKKKQLSAIQKRRYREQKEAFDTFQKSI